MSAITQVSRGSTKKARIDQDETSHSSSTAALPESQVQSFNADQVATDETETLKVEDGLAFWVATKTMNFRMADMEVNLKKIMVSAGFSIEECSVCYILS